MKHILLILCIFVIFITFSQISTTQEGFNSYFRQTIRPHVRTINDIRNTTGEKFSMRFADIGRILGII